MIVRGIEIQSRETEVSLEFAGTALAAEIVRDAPVRKGRGGPSFVHVHAANRITLQLWGWLNGDSGTLDGSGHSSRFVIGRQILRRVLPGLGRPWTLFGGLRSF